MICRTDKKIRPIANTTYSESAASISPNGRHVAFQSDENGSDQIYLAQTLNPKGTKQQLTGTGGKEPVWASDGTELFFRNGSDLLALKIDPESGKTQGVPEVAF
ncbi:MAG: TolB family protein [Limisphaerales bacterium]